MKNEQVTMDLCLEMTETQVQASLVYNLVHGNLDPLSFHAGEARQRECLHPPERWDLILHVVDSVLKLHGVEFIDHEGTEIAYCNTGDTYTLTLCYVHDEFRITSWGDIVEELDRIAWSEATVKERALAAHLEVPIQSVSEETCQDNLFTSTEAPGEYLVLTEKEADDALDVELENHIDEIIIPQLPEPYRGYFDYDRWKRDAAQDGRGAWLSHYDSEENEAFVRDDDGTEQYLLIYRTN